MMTLLFKILLGTFDSDETHCLRTCKAKRTVWAEKKSVQKRREDIYLVRWGLQDEVKMKRANQTAWVNLSAV